MRAPINTINEKTLKVGKRHSSGSVETRKTFPRCTCQTKHIVPHHCVLNSTYKEELCQTFCQYFRVRASPRRRAPVAGVRRGCGAQRAEDLIVRGGSIGPSVSRARLGVVSARRERRTNVLSKKYIPIDCYTLVAA